MRYFVYAIIGIVAAAVIGGFFIVGSPNEKRLRRFDERRLEDLQFLQSEIINYWLNKGRLPESLPALKDDIRGIAVPKDPETAADYDYQIKATETFSLCASFNRPSLSQAESVAKPIYPAGYYGQQNWEHGAGLTCFERTIDKEIYKPQKIRQ